MKSVWLTAYPRNLVKRTGVKKVRQAGRVPAVIYGRQSPPRNLEIEVKDFKTVLHRLSSQNILVDVSIEGSEPSKRLALIQEVQHHPLSQQLLHVDLHEVSETEKVTITVPVETVGEAVGVKIGGGVLEHVLFRLKVRGLPKDLPESLEVDVSALEIGQSVHIGDIKLPEGSEIIGEKKLVVLSVAAPLTETQAAEAEAGAAGPVVPEMIKEKKEEGDAKAAAPEKGEKAAEKKPAEKKPAEKKK